MFLLFWKLQKDIKFGMLQKRAGRQGTTVRHGPDGDDSEVSVHMLGTTAK